MKLLKIIDNETSKNHLKEIIFSFFVIFLSIIIVFYGIDHRLYSLDFLRFLQWIGLILLSIFLLFFLHKEKKFSFIENFFLLYFILCGVGSFYYSIGIEWLLLSLVIFFLNLNKFSKSKFYLLSSIIFTNMFILLIVAYSFYLVRDIFFSAEGFYGIITYAKNEKGVNIPRSSGLSRSLSYIFLTLLSLQLALINNRNKIFQNFICIIFLFLLLSLILKLESRGSLLSLIFSIYCLINIFLYLKIKFLKLFILNLILIIIFAISINFISFRQFNGFEIFLKSSGRFESWLLAISEVELLILGFGLQADRNLFSVNISNMYIYSYLSAGIFGFFAFFLHIYLILKYLFKSLKSFFLIKKEFFSLFLFNYCFLIFSYFIFRGLVENSFAIVSLDFIIWLTLINSIIYLKKLYGFKKSYK